MNPITAPNLINQGILVFFPGISSQSKLLLRLEIYFTLVNPMFSWLVCDNSESKIWGQTINFGQEGALFIYQINKDLDPGFYRIKSNLLSSNQPKTGELTIGISSPQPYLVIGTPYSMYPPILMS